MDNVAVKDIAVPEVAGDTRKNLIGISLEELTQDMKAMGLPAFRARQIWHGLYVKGAQKFADITTISKELQPQLEERFSLARPVISQDQKSVDGTRKWLLKLADGQEI